jgi:CelD/BcsL family acetyltransferase involved in cellulose biosynthesis
VAKTPITSFQQIAADWESVLSVSPVNSLFLSPQWQEVWWESFGDGRQMDGFYLTAPEGNGVAAIASLARVGDTVSFMGSQDTFDYNDFMIRPGYEQVFFQSLLDRLADGDYGELRLDSLIESSPTLELLPGMARKHGYTVEIEQEDVTSGVVLPETWEDYLGYLSKKDRHELRRKLRRLDANGEWRSYSVTAPGEVAGRLGEFLQLMRSSKTDKAEFMTPEREQFFHRITERMAELDLIRLYFLDLKGETVAASLCFDYGSSRLLYNSGYNPEFAYYSVGLLLNAMCLRDAIEEGFEYFDFLRGPEPYKQHLGGRQRNLFKMVVRRS